MNANLHKAMTHEYYMQQALELARKGWPQVAPNPMVGCIIEHRGEIVASGYHQKFGEAHAEVNAIRAIPPQIPTAECTLYVTLEPCSHHGKTPPCSDLIIRSGFKTVVVACKDPNPLVSGKGIERLERAGVKVISGVLETQARELNKRFICFFEKKRPYIFLKWAQTADGFISKLPLPSNRSENWISGAESNAFVHQLRAEIQAIFVGKNTVLNDDPALTTRLVKGANPIRLFLDRNLEVPITNQIYNNEAPTLVFNALKEEIKGNIQFIKLDFQGDVLARVFDKLYELKLQSVLVEGGAMLLNSIIQAGLWDEALIIENPNLYFREGLTAPDLGKGHSFTLLGQDKLYNLRKI